MIKCDYCDKEFEKKKSMTNHRRWHKIPKYKESQISHRINISKTKLGCKNPQWKGDKVGYVSLHEWLRDNKPMTDLCECCKKNKPYDVANINGEYNRDIQNYEWLCRRCHMKKDGRLEAMKTIGNLNYKNRIRNEKGRWL